MRFNYGTNVFLNVITSIAAVSILLYVLLGPPA